MSDLVVGEGASKEEAASPELPTSEKDGIDGLIAAIAGHGCGLRELVLDAGADRLSPGDRVADFTIVRRIGGGGMGEVFLAQQDAPRRMVALKVLHPECLSDAGIRRLRAEATLLDRARHPSIVTVYSAGSTRRADGATIGYLAMELVKGGVPITAALPRGAAIEQTLRIFLELSDAVAHAHRNGVVHLDLKPTNALVASDGAVKLIDFGLARAADGVVPQTDCPSGATGWIGTYEYMAPEQFERTPSACDARADVYSLGVLLHELLTGARPHNLSGLSPFGIGHRLLQSVPPNVRAALPNAPTGLAEVVRKCLEPLADMRYADATELCADVRAILRGEAPRTSSLRVWQRGGRWLRIHHWGVRTACALVIGASLFGIGAFRWHRSQQAAELAQSRLHAAHLREASAALVRGQLVLASLFASRANPPSWESRAFAAIPSRSLLDLHAEGPIVAAGLSADDRVLAYSAGGRTLHLARLDRPDVAAQISFDATLLECRLGAQPSGIGLARLANNRFATFEVDPPRVRRHWTADCASLAPEGDRIASIQNATLSIVDVHRPDAPTLSMALPTERVRAVAWSRDDQLIIAGGDRVWRIRLDVPSAREPVGKGDVSAPRWERVYDPASPLPRTILQVWEHEGDVFRLSLEAGLERLTNGAWEAWPNLDTGLITCSVAFSPNGHLVALGTQVGSLYLVDRQTGELTCNHSAHSGSLDRVGWSSSSRYVYSASTDGHVRIWPSIRDHYCPRSDSPTVIAERISHVATSDQGDVVAVADPGGTIRVLRVRPVREIFDEVNVGGELSGLALSSDGLTLSWCRGGDLFTQPVATRDLSRLRSEPDNALLDLARWDDWLYTLRADGSVECVHANTGEVRWRRAIGEIDQRRAAIARVTRECVVLQTGRASPVGVALSSTRGDLLSEGRFGTDWADEVDGVAFHPGSGRWYCVLSTGVLLSDPPVAPPGAGYRSDSTGPCFTLTLTPDDSRLIAITDAGFPTVFDPETLEMSAWIAPAPVLSAVDFAFAGRNEVLTVASSDGRIRQFNAPSPFRQPPYLWRPTFESGGLRFERVLEDSNSK